MKIGFGIPDAEAPSFPVEENQGHGTCPGNSNSSENVGKHYGFSRIPPFYISLVISIDKLNPGNKLHNDPVKTLYNF
jgi:hypothetical protein